MSVEDQNDKKERQDANACMAIGAGVGLIGTAAAVISGAMCPLCVVVAPGLIGIGAYKRWKCTPSPVERDAQLKK